MSEIFTLRNLWNAYENCKRRKKNTINAIRFELNREKNIIALLQELKSKQYNVSRHIYFIVKDPTAREVFAADFRDRIVHHLLCNELQPLFEMNFIENSFANRIGKGSHKGVEVLIKYLKEAEEGCYYLKLDIKSFFRSIDKDILFRLVIEKIRSSHKSGGWKKEIEWLCEKIIYHDPTKNYTFRGEEKSKELIPKEKSLFYSQGKGLPIGNLTSQFFANIYLHELDIFIQSRGHKRYARYVDDFVILGGREIIQEIPVIQEFLHSHLGLKLAEKKIKFQEVNRGIDFLGYYIKPHYTLVRRKIVKRFKFKMRNANGKPLPKIMAMANSYYAHFMHANSFILRKNTYEKYFKGIYEVKSEYHSLKTKK